MSMRATDADGREIKVGDIVEVPYEGAKEITELSRREKNGLPIISFACDDPRGIGGLEGWEYTDSVRLLIRKSG